MRTSSFKNDGKRPHECIVDAHENKVAYWKTQMENKLEEYYRVGFYWSNEPEFLAYQLLIQEIVDERVYERIMSLLDGPFRDLGRNLIDSKKHKINKKHDNPSRER